jgi:hypothetical protein
MCHDAEVRIRNPLRPANRDDNSDNLRPAAIPWRYHPRACRLHNSVAARRRAQQNSATQHGTGAITCDKIC